MQKRNLKCSLQCDNDETQVHMFEACTPILSRQDVPHTLRIQNIYGNIDEQRNAVKIFRKLDGVGPVDNRPSTDKLNHFVHKKNCDM